MLAYLVCIKEYSIKVTNPTKASDSNTKYERNRKFNYSGLLGSKKYFSKCFTFYMNVRCKSSDQSSTKKSFCSYCFTKLHSRARAPSKASQFGPGIQLPFIKRNNLIAPPPLSSGTNEKCKSKRGKKARVRTKKSKRNESFIKLSICWSLC